MQNLHQQIKKFAKNLEKELNKELSKTNIKIRYKTEGQEMGFYYLDDESKKILDELVAKNEEGYFMVNNEMCPLDIIQDLDEKGYIKISGKPYQNLNSRGSEYSALIMITRNGKCYDELKARYEEHKTTAAVTNYGTMIGEINESNVQIGTNNSNIEITNDVVNEVLNEITNNIDNYGLSEEDKQELKELVEDVKEKQTKKPSLVKRGLKTIWNFAKEVGCQVLAAYMVAKCGF